jgi:hypothetical protein
MHGGYLLFESKGEFGAFAEHGERAAFRYAAIIFEDQPGRNLPLVGKFSVMFAKKGSKEHSSAGGDACRKSPREYRVLAKFLDILAQSRRRATRASAFLFPDRAHHVHAMPQRSHRMQKSIAKPTECMA